MGGKTGPNPTDRGKRGAKRSVLTDGRGIPIGVALEGANRNDHLLMRDTLDSLGVKRPRPTRRRRQHLCLDKGYDYAEPRRLAAERGFTLHLRTRGEEAKAKRRRGAKARRWVVEAAHSWTNRFRDLQIRWCKKPENYLALTHFGFGIIAWRQCLPGQALSRIAQVLPRDPASFLPRALNQTDDSPSVWLGVLPRCW